MQKGRVQISQGRDKEQGKWAWRCVYEGDDRCKRAGRCSSGSAQQTEEASGTALAPDEGLALQLGISAAHFTPDMLSKRQETRHRKPKALSH